MNGDSSNNNNNDQLSTNDKPDGFKKEMREHLKTEEIKIKIENKVRKNDGKLDYDNNQIDYDRVDLSKISIYQEIKKLILRKLTTMSPTLDINFNRHNESDVAKKPNNEKISGSINPDFDKQVDYTVPISVNYESYNFETKGNNRL